MEAGDAAAARRDRLVGAPAAQALADGVDTGTVVCNVMTKGSVAPLRRVGFLGMGTGVRISASVNSRKWMNRDGFRYRSSSSSDNSKVEGDSQVGNRRGGMHLGREGAEETGLAASTAAALGQIGLDGAGVEGGDGAMVAAGFGDARAVGGAGVDEGAAGRR